MTVALSSPVLDPMSVLNARTKDMPSHCWSYKLASGGYGLDFATDGDLGVDESKMSAWIPFASGQRRDGVGDLLEVGGIRTERHQKNPIILFDHGKGNHKWANWPIALAEDRDTKAYTVVIDPVMQTAQANAFFYQGKGITGANRDDEKEFALYCEQIFDLWAKKFIRAGSIGYQVVKAMPLQPDYENGTPQGLHLLVTLMLECSAVVLPANQDTTRKMLAMPKVCGKPMSPYLIKSLQVHASENTKMVSGYEGKGFYVRRQRLRDTSQDSQLFGGDKTGTVQYSRTFRTEKEAQREADAWNNTGGEWKAEVVQGVAPSKSLKSMPLTDARVREIASLADIRINNVYADGEIASFTMDGNWFEIANLVRNQGYAIEGKLSGPGSYVKLTRGKSLKSIRMKYRGKGNLKYPYDYLMASNGNRIRIGSTVILSGNRIGVVEALHLDSSSLKVRFSDGRDIWIEEKQVIRVDNSGYGGLSGKSLDLSNIRMKYRGKSATPAELSNAWLEFMKREYAHRMEFDEFNRIVNAGNRLINSDPELFKRNGLLFLFDLASEKRLGLGGKSLDLSNIRKKYRSAKNYRRRLRKSSPGSSVLHVSEKDVAVVKSIAEQRGLKFQRVGGGIMGLEKIKLIGDDGSIDEVAKMYGKSLPQENKSQETVVKKTLETQAKEISVLSKKISHLSEKLKG